MERNSLKEGPGLSVIIAKAQQQPVFVPQLPGLWQLIWALKGLQVMGKFFFFRNQGLRQLLYWFRNIDCKQQKRILAS